MYPDTERALVRLALSWGATLASMDDDDTVEITRIDAESEMRVTRLYTEQRYQRQALPALLREAADWLEDKDEEVHEAGPVDGIRQALQVTAISYQDDGVDGETLTIVWTT